MMIPIWLWWWIGSIALGEGTAVQFVPQISLLTPSEFTLSSDKVEVHYAGDNVGQPFLHIGGQRHLKTLGRLHFYGGARIGYTIRTGLHHVRLMESGHTDSDSIRLHWIPMSTTFIAEYDASSFLRPYFNLSSGAHLLFQRGHIEEAIQPFFLPFISTGFGVTFLNLEPGDGDTILGFSFGCSYQNTLITNQPIRGWSLDFGFNLML